MSKPTTEGLCTARLRSSDSDTQCSCHVFTIFYWEFGAAKTLGVTKLLIDIITLRCCTEEAKLLSQLSLVRLHHSNICRLVACECLNCRQGDCGQSFNEEGTDLKQSMEMTVVAYILLWNDLKISQT